MHQGMDKEWRTRMNVKELQHICTDMAVSLFRISTATAKEVILRELKMILTKAQTLPQDKDLTKFDFSFYPDVDSNKRFLQLIYQFRMLSFVAKTLAFLTN
jgi:hypothetical protein